MGKPAEGLTMLPSKVVSLAPGSRDCRSVRLALPAKSPLMLAGVDTDSAVAFTMGLGDPGVPLDKSEEWISADRRPLSVWESGCRCH